MARVVACRLAGSLARSWRRSADNCCAPVCQALLSATTWSICTAAASALREKDTDFALYGSCSTPVSTTQSRVRGLKVVSSRSRPRMSLRVSQPLWPPATSTSSVQASPNSAREYPVFGARPFTGKVTRTATAASAWAAEMAGVGGPAVGDGAFGDAAVGDAVVKDGALGDAGDGDAVGVVATDSAVAVPVERESDGPRVVVAG